MMAAALFNQASRVVVGIVAFAQKSHGYGSRGGLRLCAVAGISLLLAYTMVGRK